MVVAVSIGLFAGFGLGGGSNPSQAANEDVSPVIATVGSQEIRAGVVESLAEQQIAGMGAQMSSFGPELQARFTASTLKQVIEQTSLLAIAQENKVDLSENGVLAMVEAGFKQQLEQEKQRLIGTGELKAGATQAELEAAIKKVSPDFSIDDTLKQQIDSAKQGYADPIRRPQLLAYTAQQALRDGYAKAVPSDDGSVKTLFNRYITKRILITPEGSAGETPKALAEKALAEIKGGLAFEAAMERYSKDTPEPKKSLRDSLSPVLARSALSDPLLKPITQLKAGEVTGVIDQGTNATIYKLIEVKAEVPTDFEQKKTQYADEYRMAVATGQLQEAIRSHGEKNPVVWKSKGYEALYRYLEIADQGSFAVGDAKKARTDELKAIIAEAKESLNEAEPMGQRAATYALFATNSLLYSEATPEEKKAMIEERLEAITIMLGMTEGAQLRLEMVDLLTTKKDVAAGAELARVAESNFDTSPQGQALYQEVSAKLRKLEESKLVSAEEKARIEAAQDQWRTLKRDADKAEAEAKKLQEEAEKAAKAEEAKAKEAPKPRSQGEN